MTGAGMVRSTAQTSGRAFEATTARARKIATSYWQLSDKLHSFEPSSSSLLHSSLPNAVSSDHKPEVKSPFLSASEGFFALPCPCPCRERGGRLPDGRGNFVWWGLLIGTTVGK